MSRPGRPRNATPSVRFAIAGWLHPEYDADIIAWLNAIPKGERMNALKSTVACWQKVVRNIAGTVRMMCR